MNGVIIPSSGSIKVVNFVNSTTPTIAAYGDATYTIDTFSIPSGYTPLACLKVSAGQIQMEVTEFNAQTGAIKIHNYGSSNRACAPEMTVAFIKSSEILT